MAVLDIVLYPDPVLSRPGIPVAEVTDEIRQLADDMVETMYDAPGVGLAAPQIGRSLRMCVIDCSEPEEDGGSSLHIMINPRIIERSGEITWNEGCLSMPGLYRDVKRADYVVVEHLNRAGELVRFEGDGLLAVCCQHEIDHLDGVMFTDRLGPLRKKMALKEWKRLRARIDRGEDVVGRDEEGSED